MKCVQSVIMREKEVDRVNDRFLKVPDIARELDIEEETVREWLRKGLLAGYRVGKEWRIAREDYEAFLAKRRNVEEKPDKTQ